MKRVIFEQVINGGFVLKNGISEKESQKIQEQAEEKLDKIKKDI